MRIERHHLYWALAAAVAFVLLAVVVSNDAGGFFSAPALMQE
jgi:hypothetical protein